MSVADLGTQSGLLSSFEAGWARSACLRTMLRSCFVHLGWETRVRMI